MKTHTLSWDVLWLYMCSHLCRTERFILSVSSKQKWQNGGWKHAILMKHMFTTQRLLWAGPRVILQKIHTQQNGAVSACHPASWCQVIPFAPFLNGSTEATDALCRKVRPDMGWERDVFLHEADWKGITLLLPELCTCPAIFTFHLAWLSLIDNGNMGLDKCRYHTD